MEELIFERLKCICDAKTNNLVELAEVAAPSDKSFFKGASFDGVDIRGLDLTEFDLSKTSLAGAIFDETTKLNLTQGMFSAIFRRNIGEIFNVFQYDINVTDVTLNLHDSNKKVIYETKVFDEVLYFSDCILLNIFEIRDHIEQHLKNYSEHDPISLQDEYLLHKLEKNIQQLEKNSFELQHKITKFNKTFIGIFARSYKTIQSIPLPMISVKSKRTLDILKDIYKMTENIHK